MSIREKLAKLRVHSFHAVEDLERESLLLSEEDGVLLEAATPERSISGGRFEGRPEGRPESRAEAEFADSVLGSPKKKRPRKLRAMPKTIVCVVFETAVDELAGEEWWDPPSFTRAAAHCVEEKLSLSFFLKKLRSPLLTPVMEHLLRPGLKDGLSGAKFKQEWQWQVFLQVITDPLCTSGRARPDASWHPEGCVADPRVPAESRFRGDDDTWRLRAKQMLRVLAGLVFAELPEKYRFIFSARKLTDEDVYPTYQL